MSLTVSANAPASIAPNAGLSPRTAAAPVATKSPPAATAQAASHQQQQAALNQLVTRYAYDQTHQTDAATLAKLGRQILAEAKTLGTRVTLPHAASASGAAVAPVNASATGGVKLTA